MQFRLLGSEIRLDRFRSAGAFLAVVLITHVASSPGDTYTQHTTSSIGDITSQTVATVPADRTRTTIGIGEQVTCSIDPGTWVDKDCNTTANAIEDDTIGDRQWSASGAGTVSPTTAGANNSATLTSHHSPGGVTIKVTVNDSGTKFDDVVTKSKTFSVVAPSGIDVAFDADLSPYAAGPPNAWIGASQRFIHTVQPTTVNFDQANLRDDWATENRTWPDNTNEAITGFRQTWSVGVIGGTHNRMHHVTTEHQPIARLDSAAVPGVNYVDFKFTWHASCQYRNQASTWVGFVNFEATRNYTGATQKCVIEHKASNTAQSGAVGPWKN